MKHADAHIEKTKPLQDELVECIRWTKGMTTERGWKTWEKWRDQLLAKAATAGGK